MTSPINRQRSREQNNREIVCNPMQTQVRNAEYVPGSPDNNPTPSNEDTMESSKTVTAKNSTAPRKLNTAQSEQCFFGARFCTANSPHYATSGFGDIVEFVPTRQCQLLFIRWLDAD